MRARRWASFLWASLPLALLSIPIDPQAAADPAREQAAEEAFQRQDWKAAAAAYEALLREAPANAQHALRWGTSLHELGRYGEAVGALEKARDLGAPKVAVEIALAEALARHGDAGAAFAALARSAEAGAGPFGARERLVSDPDFVPLRADPRWGGAVTAFDRNVRPCLYAPEFRQFDFWVGEWDVTPNGAPPGTLPSASSIQLILEGCVILESWTSVGYAGKSFSHYEPATGKWRQAWVDTQGSLHLYEGEARDGNLYFTGESATSGGGKTLYKLSFLRQGRDDVRQLWEQSRDGGKSWFVAFDGIYRRKTDAGRTSYPAARTEAIREEVSGVDVPDPYRWLESLESPETRAWVAAEDELARHTLDGTEAFARFRGRLAELTAIDGVGVPVAAGGRLFFLRTPVESGRPSVWVADGEGEPPRLLLDAAALGAGERIGGIWPSPDGRLLAFGAGSAASPWSELRLLDAESGRILPEGIRGLRGSGGSPAWRRDGRSFFYGRFEAPPSGAEIETPVEHHRLYEHRVGEDPRADRLVLERPDQKHWVFSPAVTSDGRSLVVTTSLGSAPGARIDRLDLGSPDGAWVNLVPETAAPSSFLDQEGETVFLQTTDGAPRGRVVRLDAADPRPVQWRTLIPEARDTLYAVNAVGDRFVSIYLRDARHQVRVFSRDGRFERELALPDLGTTYSGFVGRPRDRYAYFSFNSLAYPGSATVFRLDPGTGETTPFQRPALGHQPEGFLTRQVFFTSRDGTRVPMFLAHRRDLQPGVKRPVFLYAYGAFGWAALPWYQPQILAWMEAGGTYALANIRGGGEYGLDWYRDGVGANRRNAIDDYLAAASWLVDSGLTSPELLVANGGSASGALPALAIAERPDLFGAAVIDIPILDMVRFERFTGGARWASEFGSASDPEQLRRLYEQSPYHRLVGASSTEVACYPPTLVTAGEVDQTAVPSHAYKFVAALQARQRCPRPVLLQVVAGGGHGFGTSREQSGETWARQLAFLAQVLPEGALAAGEPPARGLESP